MNPFAEAMQQYLQSANATIQSLELRNITFNRRCGAGKILDGLNRNTSVHELSFSYCLIGDLFGLVSTGDTEEHPRKFATVLQSKPDLKALRFSQHYNFFYFPVIFNAVQDLLTRRGSPLKCFDFHVFHDTLDFQQACLPLAQFQTVMTAVTNSTSLERLVIRNMCSRDIFTDLDEEGYFEALEAFIPSIKVTELHLSFAEEAEDPQEERLLEKFKRNYNVQSVALECLETQEPWLNEANRARLESYLDRNRKLAQ